MSFAESRQTATVTMEGNDFVVPAKCLETKAIAFIMKLIFDLTTIHIL